MVGRGKFSGKVFKQGDEGFVKLNSKLFLNVGAQVYCKDRKYGRLVEVILDPTTLQAMDLIVERETPFKQVQRLPITLVEATAPGEIFLILNEFMLNIKTKSH
jgi:hypothetical protein